LENDRLIAAQQNITNNDATRLLFLDCKLGLYVAFLYHRLI